MDILSSLDVLAIPMTVNTFFNTAHFIEENNIESYFLPAIIINFIPGIVGNLILKNFKFDETIFIALLIGLPLIAIARKNMVLKKISFLLSFVGRINSLIKLGKNQADIYTLIGYYVVTNAVGKYYRTFFMRKSYIYTEEEIFNLCFSIFMISLNHFSPLENNTLFFVNFIMVLLSSQYAKYKYKSSIEQKNKRRVLFKRSR